MKPNPKILPLQPATPPGRRGGYTLIEFIGVLAIMAILASMLVPVVLNSELTAMINAETTNLSNLNNALVFEITHTFQIPNENNWASVAGNWLQLPSGSVSQNARGYNRAYVYDTSGFGGLTLPYVQTNGLATVPPNPRIMIISSLSTNLPIASGGLSSNQFATIWNTPAGYIPALTNWVGTNWPGGQGNTLLIQRINLQPYFCRVVLNAIDTNVFGGVTVQSGSAISQYICICTNNQNNVIANTINFANGLLSGVVGSTLLSGPSATGALVPQTFTGWYLQGTVLNFYDTNKSTTTPRLESQAIVQNDCSYVFEDEAWRGLLTGWGTNGPGSLSSILTIAGTAAPTLISQAYTTTDITFKNLPLNYNDWNGWNHGDSCTAMSGCFHRFMLDYNNWCNEGFQVGSDTSCNRCSQDASAVYNITQNMCQ